MITLDTREALEPLSAAAFVAAALADPADGVACLTSSLQVEDMVVLHLLRQHRPEMPVIFLDTGYHFAETYAYRDKIVRDWNLRFVNMQPELTVAQHEAKNGLQYLVDPTSCCGSRKVAPLLRSLEPYDLWLTGLRREQSPTRANLKKVEEHHLPNGKRLWKLSPLADWTWEQVWEYTRTHNIPHLPLYDQGYTSIGCEPCTQRSDDPANARAGRWGGKKLECGIHTFDEAK